MALWPMTRRGFAAGAIALTAALTMTACGSGDSGGSATTSAILKVGVVSDNVLPHFRRTVLS